MDEAEFRSLLTDYLVPMFAGTLGERAASKQSHGLVSYDGPCALLLKPSKSDLYRIELQRSQPFAPEEKNLVEFFVKELESITKVGSDHLRDLMASIPRRVISRLLAGGDEKRRTTLERAIQKLEALASETYEGRPVVVALGLGQSDTPGPISLDELWREDFSKVLSNGFDSMYVCDSDGRVFDLEYLVGPNDVGFAPHRLGSIAEWCSDDVKTAIVLNRNGEVLVFKDKKLQFAKRRGAWRHYAHDSVVQRIRYGNPALRRAVYESCLDVSFARSGGCIAIVSTSKGSGVKDVLDDKDWISKRQQVRTKLLAEAIDQKFHKLDRRFRQELLSMDGATILSHTGEVLTAGSIISVPGGSSGGGRRAAAMALSDLGVAIKISADGPITGFKSKIELFAL
jgi:hypothetical protein